MTTPVTVTAADFFTPEQVEDGAILARGGRTGKKVHLGAKGSSTTRCGHWTKHDLRHYRVSEARVEDLCVRCIAPTEFLTQEG